jgi:hypothetical protein
LVNNDSKLRSFVTSQRQAWNEITSLTFRHEHEDASAPVIQIGVRQLAKGWDYSVSLSGVPNGIFFARLIARAAAAHGVDLRDHQ